MRLRVFSIFSVSSLSMFSIVNNLSGWVVADHTLTCPSAHLVAKYLLANFAKEITLITGDKCAYLMISI